MIIEKCFAKINLVLNITGRRDGLHTLDSIVTPFGIWDTITAVANNCGQINVKYLNCPPINNDVTVTTAKLIMDRYKTPGVDITLRKGIPFCAGLGGSSADAGGVGRAMSRLFGIDIDKELLLEVGSDAPYMFVGGDKRLRGVGEIITDISLPKTYKVAVVPSKGVSAKDSYQAFDRTGGENIDIEEWLFKVNTNEVIPCHNALQRGSESINGQIGRVCELMERCGFCPCMTGSGSGVFAYELNYEEYLRKLNLLRQTTKEYRIYGEEEYGEE